MGVTKSMGMVVKGMDRVLGSMNVEATMNASTTAAMPEEEVDTLMQMVADEHGLKMEDKFKAAGSSDLTAGASAAGSSQQPQAAAIGAAAEDDLEERLRKLRSG